MKLRPDFLKKYSIPSRSEKSSKFSNFLYENRMLAFIEVYKFKMRNKNNKGKFFPNKRMQTSDSSFISLESTRTPVNPTRSLSDSLNLNGKKYT